MLSYSSAILRTSMRNWFIPCQLQCNVVATPFFQVCQKCVLINYGSIMHGDVVCTRHKFYIDQEVFFDPDIEIFESIILC